MTGRHGAGGLVAEIATVRRAERVPSARHLRRAWNAVKEAGVVVSGFPAKIGETVAALL